jgi:hypothetical protein
MVEKVDEMAIEEISGVRSKFVEKVVPKLN